ncbi:MAG: roadblock/LC7 domain-containing protein [Desulfuromonadales bacterium]|nr:roadblock/LC7 domain-containing protein [Desulfuromonadales bacterium]
MSFKQTLENLIERVPGALGAIFADWEGEAVDQVSRIGDYELKVIGAHKGIILTNMRLAMRDLESDILEEIVVTTERCQTLILPVTQDYYLVLTLKRSEMLGRALFEARRTIAILRNEIV